MKQKTMGNFFFFFLTFEITSALVEDHHTSQTNSHMYNFLKYSICISPEQIFLIEILHVSHSI